MSTRGPGRCPFPTLLSHASRQTPPRGWKAEASGGWNLPQTISPKDSELDTRLARPLTTCCPGRAKGMGPPLWKAIHYQDLGTVWGTQSQGDDQKCEQRCPSEDAGPLGEPGTARELRAAFEQPLGRVSGLWGGACADIRDGLPPLHNLSRWPAGPAWVL